MDINFNKWCEQLLDAGKRNKLINFKDSKLRSLEILAPNIKIVFDKIKNGSRLSFFDVDRFVKLNEEEDFSESNFDNEEENTRIFSKQQIVSELSSRIRQNELLAYKRGYTLKKVLGTIKKVAKESLDEKGLNILYMAFGFLRWRESEDSNIWYNSPLVLIPVSVENNSANEPFFISAYEDELSTNPTLLYKIKSDFNVAIPEFNEDDDLSNYFDSVECIVSSLGWSVVKEVAVATFSFHKMNMYNDLKENEDIILGNRNISKLLNISSDFSSQSPIEEVLMDDYFSSGRDMELYNVVDADSSQVEAIAKAKTGKNMVIQGPPGTGKSQTITNLIAEFLYDEKKVLFVSEKLAALKIVHKNLERVGLSDFCLELHSNKTNKKEVLTELYRTLCLAKTQVSDNADEEVASLLRSKNQLDEYVEILHTKQKIINRTPYELLGAISKFHKVQDFEYIIENIETKGSDYLLKVVDSIVEYQQAADVVGVDFRQNCWFGYNNSDTTYQKKIKLKTLLADATSYLEILSELIEQFNSKYQLAISSIDDLRQAINVFLVLKDFDFFDPNIFSVLKLNRFLELTNQLSNLQREMKEKEMLVVKAFSRDLLSLDVNGLFSRFTSEYKSIFRMFKSKYKSDMKLLKPLFTNKKLKYKVLCSILEMSTQYVGYEKQLKSLEVEAFKIINDNSFNGCWEKTAIETQKLASVLKEDFSFFQKIDIDEFEYIKTEISTHISIYESINEKQYLLSELQKDFDIDFVVFDKMSIDELIFKLSNCIDSFDKFDFWVKFVSTLNSYKELDIFDFIKQSIDNDIPLIHLDKTFKKMFYSQWFHYLISICEVLGRFSRISQDKAVESFKEKDRLKFKIAKAQIVSKLSALRPSLSLASSGGQVNTLQREALKQRKQMPVRVLLKNIPELVQNLKPCFMMSPLSVSTYLDNDKLKFDVVIFDEASQIFPWDALGSVYRAKQIIVVGDSKQMPPSNFFNAGVIDEEDDEEGLDDSLDFESILDLCAATFEQKSLRWHYRSRIEDLIAFSNKNYYNNNLVTFPSNQTENNDGVQFYFVADGIFDRKAKNNLKEAEKVVDLIYEHFQSNPNRSLGVVAFSVSQQETIENVLSKRRQVDDRFAKFFDDKLDEHFFVKNLETIQGDERDAIIFSVGYAKDGAGKFIHNFGPLNRKGGERRLNVAITRAKYNVKLVSSIRQHDIHLDNTQAVGAKLLKEYLDYAENGRDTLLSDIVVSHDATPDSAFEVEVYDVLREAGYSVDMQVGCSGFRIDLAIKHPIKDAYVLAVECDGATYHSGFSTRDRDRLRQEILERLGWNFYRIWSTDWFRNNSIEKRRLLEAVEKSIKNFDNKLKIDDDFTPPSIEPAPKTDTDFIVEKVVEVVELKDSFPIYEEANIPSIYKKYHSGYRFNFDSFIEEVVKIEQPITEELLLKRIVSVFGREKITNVVRMEFGHKMRRNRVCKKVEEYYTTDISAPIELRLPKNGVGVRDIPQISKIELANGLKQIIKNNMGINKEGLFRTLANLLGFTRIGNNITSNLEAALNFLLMKREIKKRDDLYFINEI